MNDPLDEYIIHLEAVSNLLEDANDLVIITDKKNQVIKINSNNEDFDLLVKSKKNGFGIKDNIADISYEYEKSPQGQICIRQRIKNSEFEATYQKERYGQIDLLEAVTKIQEDEHETVIICEKIEEDMLAEEKKFEDEINYEEFAEEDSLEENWEEEKAEFYSQYQIRINGDVIPFEEALKHIDACYEKTIYLENDSEDRIIEYMDLISAIQYYLEKLQGKFEDKSQER